MVKYYNKDFLTIASEGDIILDDRSFELVAREFHKMGYIIEKYYI